MNLGIDEITALIVDDYPEEENLPPQEEIKEEIMGKKSHIIPKSNLEGDLLLQEDQ